MHMTPKRNVGLIATLALMATIAIAAAHGDAIRNLPLTLGQGTAAAEKVIFDIGSGSANPSVGVTSGGVVQFSNDGTNFVSTPSANDTMCVIAATQTLTNKTLGSTDTLTGARMASFTPDGTHTITVPGATDTVQLLAAAQSPTNKTFDSTTTLTGARMASFTPDGTHTLTAPAATDTLADIAGAQAFTNKTINGSSNTLTVLAGSQLSGQVPVANGGTGAATFQTNAILAGQGTSPFGGIINASATNKFLTQSSSNAATFATIVANDLPGITQTAAGADTSARARLGTNTNDSASAGNIGEIITNSTVRSSPVTLSNNTSANVTSLSAGAALTAGDWDVTGVVGLSFGATTTVTQIRAAFSTSTGALPASTDTFGVPDANGQITINFGFPSGTTPVNDTMLVMPTTRVSLSGAGNVFLVINVLFGSTAPTAYGSIRARRVR